MDKERYTFKLKSTEIEAGKEYTTDIMSEKDADRWGN